MSSSSSHYPGSFPSQGHVHATSYSWKLSLPPTGGQLRVTHPLFLAVSLSGSGGLCISLDWVLLPHRPGISMTWDS